MTARRTTKIPDHALRTSCAIFEAHGFHLTPVELLRKLTSPEPRTATATNPNSGRSSGLLTTKQVADRLNCSPRTVLRMADDGELTRRYLRPGNAKSLRFVEAEVLALCNSMDEGE